MSPRFEGADVTAFMQKDGGPFMRSLPIFILALALGQTPQIQTAALNAAKNAIVRDLDKRLPDVTFESWLRGLVGAQAFMKWSVTDCGEATGGPADRGRDVPICSVVEVKLTGNRTLSLSLLAGSRARGVTAGPLKLFSGAIVQADPKPIIWIKTLADVPRLIGQPIPN
jgi:hypothetical protein